ncbi:MAG: hypothetical protein PUG60_05540 [Lachnospiraceae bacterium]|nr:hypothetical protein [Lachnospiraceae bacterium]MDY4970932.1 hypothetical protein [Lachnospiraceae bacterium]
MNETMKNDFFFWMDDILKREFPEDTVAICFNLYDEQDNHWAVELVGTDEYDEEDDDWACDEIIAFRDNLFRMEADTDWEDVWDIVNTMIKEYLETGSESEKLLQYEAVATGFTDSELKILYRNDEG